MDGKGKAMIFVENLIFEYPGVRALNNVSFTINAGSITALVGPNGAGKTTLLRCLAALDEPVSGAIRLNNVDVLDNPRLCHQSIGYLSDFFGLYDDLTVEKCLRYSALAHGITDRWQEAVFTAARRTGIDDRLAVKAAALSRGLRQRLAIAQAIIHEPPMLLLDEPASGLDPEARSDLAGLFLSLREQGMTLMVSSHILTELEEYSTDMLILQAGEIAGQRSLGGPKAVAPLMKVSLAERADALAELIRHVPGVTDVRIDGLNAWFRFSGEARERHYLLKRLIEHGIPVSSFSEETADMQHEYLAVVRKSNRNGEAAS